ncbi:diacylglycerol acyltransferase [Basidiobolus meristosporus CBS 931.73]|uniref:Diacylglycerol O-acyltransferase n=1 Tax=Basidiobolus meristosporus CBS 931.73 TaxID=1314790 RepID=A0A1Y1YCZ9_9FUNG|nr:diacylglycerol acyltransferase [Basidiobolus meristosporus CBS 931.73]|eukprot:ORX95815.1 diacylglycerol acyltransferase [Basidiobolus meristosporus CBS 931.73]
MSCLLLVVILLNILCFSSSVLFPFYLIYLGWIFIFDRKTSSTGGRSNTWMRGSKIQRYFGEHFPAKIHKEVELPTDQNYILSTHPHGVWGFGAQTCLASDACGFSELFPGIDMRLVTLNLNLNLPFLREYLLWRGFVSANPESINYLLSQRDPKNPELGVGKAVGLLPGGAAEALHSEPGTHRLVLKKRKGMFRLALLNGASLVPTYVFGETDLYSQIRIPWLRNTQKWLQKRIHFAPVMYYWLLPRSHPIVCVIGKPIPVKKLKPEEITPEAIANLQNEYIKALCELFDRHKDTYAKDRKSDLEIIE